MALPVLTFLVGGAAIGGLVVLAKHAADNGTHDKPGNAEPPPITPGGVDLSGYQNTNANGGSSPTGTVVSDGAGGGQPAGSPTGGTFGTSIGSDDAGKPVQVSVTGGVFEISQPPGGGSIDQPGVISPTQDPSPSSIDPPTTAVRPTRVLAAFSSLIGPKTTRQDITNAYATHGSAAGMVI